MSDMQNETETLTKQHDTPTDSHSLDVDHLVPPSAPLLVGMCW